LDIGLSAWKELRLRDAAEHNNTITPRFVRSYHERVAAQEPHHRATAGHNWPMDSMAGHADVLVGWCGSGPAWPGRKPWEEQVTLPGRGWRVQRPVAAPRPNPPPDCSAGMKTRHNSDSRPFGAKIVSTSPPSCRPRARCSNTVPNPCLSGSLTGGPSRSIHSSLSRCSTPCFSTVQLTSTHPVGSENAP
jgi:hypothetical protein